MIVKLSLVCFVFTAISFASYLYMVWHGDFQQEVRRIRPCLIFDVILCVLLSFIWMAK